MYFSAGSIYTYELGTIIKIVHIKELSAQAAFRGKIHGTSANSASFDTTNLTVSNSLIASIKEDHLNAAEIIKNEIAEIVSTNSEQSFYGTIGFAIAKRFSERFSFQTSLSYSNGRHQWVAEQTRRANTWECTAGADAGIKIDPLLIQPEYFYRRKSIGDPSHFVMISAYHGAGSSTHIGVGVGKLFIKDQNIWRGSLTARHYF